MECSLGVSNFLEEIPSLSHSVVFLHFFALIAEKGFLISPCYSLELCIQLGNSFLFSFAFMWWGAARGFRPSGRHAGEKRGVAGLLLGRTERAARAAELQLWKSKGEKERYKHLNAEFQRIARRDKKAFLSNQCKEMEENNRMGKTRDLFKKIRDTKGTFHAKMSLQFILF